MRLNEGTYQYIEQAAFQLESLTCTLAKAVENARNQAYDYHYRVYFAFINNVRSKFLAAVRNIKDMFVGTRQAVEDITVTVLGEREVNTAVISAMSAFDDVLTLLVIRCEGIARCQGETDNPIMANADDAFYRSFSGYRNCIANYQLSEPQEADDIVSKVIYDFYSESIKIYEKLFGECDKMLLDIGEKLDVRRKSLDSGRRSSQMGNLFDDAKTMLSGLTGAAKKVRERNPYSAAEKLVSIGTSLAEKYVDSVPRESIGRKLIDGLDNMGKVIELVDNMANAMGSDIKESYAASAIKLFTAITLINQDMIDLQKLKESGKLDIVINLAGVGSNVMRVMTSKGIFSKVLKLPSTVDSAFGLYEAVLKRYSDVDVHVRLEPVDHFLHEQAKKMDDYNKKLEI